MSRGSFGCRERRAGDRTESVRTRDAERTLVKRIGRVVTWTETEVRRDMTGRDIA